MEIMGVSLISIVVSIVIAKIMSLPFKIVWKLVSNGIIGAIMLWAVNLFGAGIEITVFKALIAGFFGIPGVVVIFIASFL